jgi:cysteine synthase A
VDESVLDTIGSPLVRVGSPPGTTVAAKLESRNPAGSAKDRPAVAMVEAAEAAGELEPGDRLVEPTSGNTGIGLAMVAAAKGYDLTVVMPASKSPERRRLVRAYGADLELVEGDISDARERADAIEAAGAVQLRQFENPANPTVHYETTGAEVVEQVDRPVDALVAGVGTGGTISGVGRRLRETFPDVRIVADEPVSNPAIAPALGIDPPAAGPNDTDRSAGEASFQGMGPGFVSANTDLDLIDDVVFVTLGAAERECRRLAREEGLLVGQSSGASCLAARRVASALAASDDLPEAPIEAVPTAAGTGGDPDGPLVATVCWDSGERYLSTGLFDG